MPGLNDPISFLGVDGLSGKRAFEPMPLCDVATLFTNAHDPDLAGQRARQEALETSKGIGFSEEVEDPNDLGQTGWGIVFTEHADKAYRSALKPLIEHRRAQIEQTRRPEDADKILFRDDLIIKSTDTIEDLRARWQFSPGIIDPGKVPGYLLIVGPASDVSFELQHDLDVDFFIGRLDLDSEADHAAYAEQLIRADARPERPRRAMVFAPTNANDDATALSCTNLAAELIRRVDKKHVVELVHHLGESATKPVLASSLGDDVPALLFTAGHGTQMPSGDDQQRAIQGALVTAEWPNDPNAFKMDPDHHFTAGDLPKGGTLDGLMAVFFACYGGGVPAQSRYPYHRNQGIRKLAPASFTAALPKAMLARGAGAVVAHVERTWDAGYSWVGVQQPQIDVWVSLVLGLLKGKRVGLSAAYLNNRYTSIASLLGVRLMKEENQGVVIPPGERAYLWMQHADARGWIVLGDPAAKIAMVPSP